MAGGAEKSGDFYAVLGLGKECSASELRSAYKKLAMRWHPDRCSASGNSKFVEEAKMKFQAIQEAYSVLSDDNKRFLYDVGAYASDDDDANGMGDFLNEMASMMCQTKPNENGNESFEQLQELFEEMFQDSYASSSSTSANSSSYESYCETSATKKRTSSDMSSGKPNSGDCFQSFSLGAEKQRNERMGKGTGGRARGRAVDRKRRDDNVSSDYSGIFT